MKIYGRIYLITNLVNAKQYIGQTVQTIKARFSNHCRSKKPVISRAIRKYGRENFIVQEIAIAYNQKRLNFLEGMYISWFNTLVSNGYGYNVTNIINGKGKHSEETIEKMRFLAKEPERLVLLSNNGSKRRGNSVKNSTSIYCGVCIYKNNYRSEIRSNNNSIYIGCYNSEVEAAKAYDIKALEIFGCNAVLNFPELRQNYINNDISINKNTKQTYSKSGIENIRFEKSRNRWQVRWFDKQLNKKKTKNFKYLEEAIQYKNEVIL